MFKPMDTRPGQCGGVADVAGLAVFCVRSMAGGQLQRRGAELCAGQKRVVPCNFRAHDEGHRFMLKGALVHGYAENWNLR